MPSGYLASVTSPAFNGVSAVTRFTYDNVRRVRTVTDSDDYTIVTDYDNLDRKTKITYPDGTFEQFQYTDNVTGAKTLDLTGSRDRRGLWTYRHYNGIRATRFDHRSGEPHHPLRMVHLRRAGQHYRSEESDDDLQSATFKAGLFKKFSKTGPRSITSTKARPLQTLLAPQAAILNRRKEPAHQLSLFPRRHDPANQLHEPCRPAVDSLNGDRQLRLRSELSSDQNNGRWRRHDHVRLQSRYRPAHARRGPAGGRRRPLANDTITFGYDQLGRVTSRSINGAANSETWTFDSLGRVSTM